MHEIFRTGKYEENIKFDEIWVCQNEGIPLKFGCQNSNFNHLRCIDEIFGIGIIWTKNKIWQNLGVPQWCVLLKRGR